MPVFLCLFFYQPVAFGLFVCKAFALIGLFCLERTVFLGLLFGLAACLFFLGFFLCKRNLGLLGIGLRRGDVFNGGAWRWRRR